MHLAEPGCAVTAHDFERYEHYVKFLAEIKVSLGASIAVQQSGELKVQVHPMAICIPTVVLPSSVHPTAADQQAYACSACLLSSCGSCTCLREAQVVTVYHVWLCATAVTAHSVW